MSFRPLFLLAEILAGRSPHLQVWGAKQPSVLCTLSNDTVGSDRSADTVIFTNVYESNAELIEEPARRSIDIKRRLFGGIKASSRGLS